MKRVKIVLSGWRETTETIVGRTRSIQGVAQRLPGAKMFCMSMQRCTAPRISATSDVASLIILNRQSAFGDQLRMQGDRFGSE